MTRDNLFELPRQGDTEVLTGLSNPDPAVFINEDPFPAAFLLCIRMQVCKKLPYEEFL